MPQMAALVSVEEYLAMDRKPNCDSIDGVLEERALPTWDHSQIQTRIIVLIDRLFPNVRGVARVGGKDGLDHRSPKTLRLELQRERRLAEVFAAL